MKETSGMSSSCFLFLVQRVLNSVHNHFNMSNHLVYRTRIALCNQAMKVNFMKQKPITEDLGGIAGIIMRNLHLKAHKPYCGQG